MWKTAQIEYRRIDPDLHADLAFDHYREACIASALHKCDGNAQVT